MPAAPVAHAGSEPDFRNTEERLAGLARAGGPLRRVLAALAARQVARKGWERLGHARLGDYARERLGVSARSLQELARVGSRLDELPALEAALVSGHLPWSKVRLLARFVTPEDEARWIGLAKRTSVRRLERELRAVDRGALEAGALATDEEGRDAEPSERVRVSGHARACLKWQRTREYASRVAGERLPSGALLEVVTAETLSALPLEVAAEAAAEPAEAGGTGWRDAVAEISSSGAASVCADSAADAGPLPGGEIPPFLSPLLDGLDEADAFELDARLRRALRLEQRLEAQIAPLLRVVTAAGYGWRVRFTTLAAYARERLGMSPRKARALLRLERVGDVCPALRQAFREGRLSWVRAQTLAPLLIHPAEGDWREAWVAHAAHVSLRRLEQQVEEVLVLRGTDPAAWERHRSHPERFGEGPDHRSSEPTSRLASVCADSATDRAIGLTIVAPRDVARLFRAVLCTLRRALERETGRLPSEGEAFEAMLDHALRSWGADDPRLARLLRRKYAVFERDGWRCTVPGCSARRNLHAHHIVFRSAGGSDALTNQTTLCAFHHQRGVHAGRVRIAGHAPDGLRYELGLRPGLPPLERYDARERMLLDGHP